MDCNIRHIFDILEKSYFEVLKFHLVKVKCTFDHQKIQNPKVRNFWVFNLLKRIFQRVFGFVLKLYAPKVPNQSRKKKKWKSCRAENSSDFLLIFLRSVGPRSLQIRGLFDLA